ncbi:sensor histidine kinase [Salipaludibacillus sp. LMS25]|uniref:cache domain-containing sensor histidine kinase n=1 Tax=Salipaludibacillus sp. LMS25 TaxID=2924031 RepID=UPI0020D1767C|nr:sensor histidine kinase [Salipaludibacillus sp. LMS25]UTR16044.1 sensor histidine kinase [Salipaludibacillus sp. LMS25]
MIKQWLEKSNTLRNQILIIFTGTMTMILLLVGMITFNLVMDLLKDNAQSQIEHTANETLARIDSQFETIDIMTSQIATNPFVQQLLVDHSNRHLTAFDKRQSMHHVINSYLAYTNGITSFELYFTDYRRLFPLNELPLYERLDASKIQQAEDEKGRMVWGGFDPQDREAFITIKQINLLDDNFSHGGYLLTKINYDFFEFRSEYGQIDMETDYAVLVDNDDALITTNLPEDMMSEVELNTTAQVVVLQENEYVRVRVVSDDTGWSLIMFKPVNVLVTGLSGIGTAIIIAGAVGFIVFSITSYFLATLLTKPIYHLTQAMRFGKLGALKESPPIISTNEMTELNNTYNHMVETTNYLINVVYEKELTRHRAELKALQAQINPHFLFNTLEALYWTLEEKDEDASNMILTMSQLFRYTISDSQREDWVTLHDEVDHIQRYLAIMKLRFTDRLTWGLYIDRNLLSCQIPKLLIQPLVENAIVHGIGNQLAAGKVTVTVTDQKNDIKISVRDDGAGMDTGTLEKLKQSMKTSLPITSDRTGLALGNIHKRLKLTYPNNANTSIDIVSQLRQGTTVTLIIPKKGVEDHEGKANFDR